MLEFHRPEPAPTHLEELPELFRQLEKLGVFHHRYLFHHRLELLKSHQREELFRQQYSFHRLELLSHQLQELLELLRLFHRQELLFHQLQKSFHHRLELLRR